MVISIQFRKLKLKTIKMNIISGMESEFDTESEPDDQRLFRERENYLESLNDSEFIRRFRVSKITFLELLNKIKPSIEPQTKR